MSTSVTSVKSAPAPQTLQRSESGKLSSWTNTIAWGLLCLFLIASWRGADLRFGELVRDSGSILKFASDFFPPNFRQWPMFLEEMVVTLQIALWGTTLAVVTAVPCGLLCSSNLVPAWVYQPVRRVMDALRAINEMVFAMLFVVAVGLGPFAGVLALWLHTTGTLSKLFSEAVEAIDPQPVEGIRATGALAIEEICYGVIPQVLPLWISYTLYRFEANVRSASVLGMVGAGGIGVLLWEYIRGFNYTETCAVLIIVVITVSLIDLVSYAVRKRAI